MRAIRAGILVGHLDHEGNRVADPQVGQNFAVIPIERLFAAAVLDRCLEGDRLLRPEVDAVGDRGGADAVVVASAHGEVQLAPEQGVEVRFRAR